jgi:hypothetical protein
MKWARRVDGPQAAIVSALRKLGVSVYDTSRAGSGFPDLVCGFRGRTWLLEVKTGSGSLTEEQEKFHGQFRGEVYVVRNIDEALGTVGTIARSIA